MDEKAYEMLLNTISITLECLNGQTTHFDPHVGPITQSIWTQGEVTQIKDQLRGLLAIVPRPAYFKSLD